MSDDFITGDEFDPEYVAQLEAKEDDKTASETNALTEFIMRRSRAYKAVFVARNATQAEADMVLLDLAHFCRAGRSTFDKADGEHAELLMHMKEGRREVITRIADHIGLGEMGMLTKYTNAFNQ